MYKTMGGVSIEIGGLTWEPPLEKEITFEVNDDDDVWVLNNGIAGDCILLRYRPSEGRGQ